MFYKCNQCGRVFEEDELSYWSESRGEFWGDSCEECGCGCPACHGDFDEASECAVCGEVHRDDDLHGGVCPGCLDKYKTDFDACLKIMEGEKESVMINIAIVSMLSEDEIEKVLIDYIKSKHTDFSEVVENDAEWFGEAVARKEGR